MPAKGNSRHEAVGDVDLSKVDMTPILEIVSYLLAASASHWRERRQ